MRTITAAPVECSRSSKRSSTRSSSAANSRDSPRPHVDGATHPERDRRRRGVRPNIKLLIIIMLCADSADLLCAIKARRMRARARSVTATLHANAGRPTPPPLCRIMDSIRAGSTPAGRASWRPLTNRVRASERAQIRDWFDVVATFGNCGCVRFSVSCASRHSPFCVRLRGSMVMKRQRVSHSKYHC